MATDKSYTRLSNKQVLALTHFKDLFLDYFINEVAEQATLNWNDDAVLSSVVVPVAADASNNKIDINLAGGLFRCATGNGSVLKFTSNDSRLQNIKIPGQAAVVYSVALEKAILDELPEQNPRTGEIEYHKKTETIGRVGTPDLVTNNFNGTITFRVNSLTKSGDNHTGRTIKVWLKSKLDGGGVGPKTTTSQFVESLPIVFNTPNNNITTSTLLGQDTGSVSTTPGDYVVALIGPVVKRKTDEDTTTTVGAVHLAEITSVAEGNLIPGGNISTVNQRLAPFNLTHLSDVLRTDAHGFRKIRVKADASDNDEPQLEVVDTGLVSKWKVDEDGDQTMSGALLPAADNAQAIGATGTRWDAFLADLLVDTITPGDRNLGSEAAGNIPRNMFNLGSAATLIHMICSNFGGGGDAGSHIFYRRTTGGLIITQNAYWKDSTPGWGHSNTSLPCLGVYFLSNRFQVLYRPAGGAASFNDSTAVGGGGWTVILDLPLDGDAESIANANLPVVNTPHSTTAGVNRKLLWQNTRSGSIILRLFYCHNDNDGNACYELTFNADWTNHATTPVWTHTATGIVAKITFSRAQVGFFWKASAVATTTFTDAAWVKAWAFIFQTAANGPNNLSATNPVITAVATQTANNVDTNPPAQTGQNNVIKMKNTCKAWGYVETDATPVVQDGFNLDPTTPISYSGSNVVITFGTGMASSNFSAVATAEANAGVATLMTEVTRTAGSVTFGMFDLTAGAVTQVNMSSTTRRFNFQIFGRQDT